MFLFTAALLTASDTPARYAPEANETAWQSFVREVSEWKALGVRGMFRRVVLGRR